MRSTFSRTSRWNAGRQQIADARRPLCEFLENRRLLSVTAAEAADGISREEQDVVGTYTGELRLRNADDQGRRLYDMTLRITDQDDDGAVDGSITIEPRDAEGNGERQDADFNNGEFGAAPKWRMHLSLDLTGEFDGLFDGHVNPNNEDRIEGGLRDADNRKFGSFRLNQTDDNGPTPTPNNPTPTPTTPTNPGTQPGGPGFPGAGTAGFAVLEVNAEQGVNIATIAQAENLLDDFNTGQAGNAADADDADAIEQYSVGQIDFGANGAAQFRTMNGTFGDDDVALEAIGVVSNIATPSATGTYTLGLMSDGAARVFVNDTQVLDLTADNSDGVVEATVPLKQNDVIRVVYVEGGTPTGQESLLLYVGGANGAQSPIGSTESGITIVAPQTPPGPVTGTPGTGTPGTGTPGTGTPGTGTPGTGTPGTGTPGTGTPGTGTPGTGTPGTGTPGTGTPGGFIPGIDPVTGLPVFIDPVTGEPVTVDPGFPFIPGLDPVTGEPVFIDPSTGLPVIPTDPDFPGDGEGGVIVTPTDPTVPPIGGGGTGTGTGGDTFDPNFPPAGPGTPGSGPGNPGSGPGANGDNTGVGDIPASPGVGDIPGNNPTPGGTVNDGTGTGTVGTGTGGSAIGGANGGANGTVTGNNANVTTNASVLQSLSGSGGFAGFSFGQSPFSSTQIGTPNGQFGNNSFTGVGRQLKSL